MNQNNNHELLLELLTAFDDCLNEIEGVELKVPKNHLPYVKDKFHDLVGDIIFKLVCIDTVINTEFNKSEDENEN